MSCSPYDLKDYFFGELPPQDRRTVEQHLSGCLKCREELDVLNIAQSALLTMREEEPPRRIAFVSDKVFEPHWWQSLWSSGPKVAFASSALLAAAILVHGFELNRPVPRIAVTQPQPSITEAEVAQRVQKAVAASEARQSAKLQQVIAQQKEMEISRKADRLEVIDSFKYLQKSIVPAYRASAYNGVSQ